MVEKKYNAWSDVLAITVIVGVVGLCGCAGCWFLKKPAPVLDPFAGRSLAETPLEAPVEVEEKEPEESQPEVPKPAMTSQDMREAFAEGFKTGSRFGGLAAVKLLNAGQKELKYDHIQELAGKMYAAAIRLKQERLKEEVEK